MFSLLIPIFVSIFVFLLYVYWREREGLQNQSSPISLMPDNTRTFNFYNELRTDSDDPKSLYENKYEKYYNADIKVDLSYFNNTSHLLYALSKLEKPGKL
jgi:hypothetical protein